MGVVDKTKNKTSKKAKTAGRALFITTLGRRKKKDQKGLGRKNRRLSMPGGGGYMYGEKVLRYLSSFRTGLLSTNYIKLLISEHDLLIIRACMPDKAYRLQESVVVKVN